MADVEVLGTMEAGSVSYHHIRVDFMGRRFDQLIVSPLSGAELTAQLQQYADEYQSSWAVDSENEIGRA